MRKRFYIALVLGFVLIPAVMKFYFNYRQEINNKIELISQQQQEIQDLKKDLKGLVEMRYPKLTDTSLSDWEKVNILRQWAHSNTDFGENPSSGRKISTLGDGESVIRKDAFEAYAYFMKDSGAVMCQGASIPLMKLYQDYGYEAITYGAGDFDTFGHAVVVVKINHNGKELWSIQDPMFDTTLIYPSGEPYDFFDMLSSLKQDDINNLIVYTPGISQHDTLCNRTKGECSTTNNSDLEEVGNGIYKYQSRLSWNNITDHPGLQRFLTDNNYPMDARYLYLHPLYIYTSYPMTEKTQPRADELMEEVRKNISIG